MQTHAVATDATDPTVQFPHLASPEAAEPYRTFGKRKPFPLTQPAWYREWLDGGNKQDPWTLTEGNGTILATWQCSKGHRWQEKLNKRHGRRDPRCPVCIEHEQEQINLMATAPRVIPLGDVPPAPQAANLNLVTVTEEIGPELAKAYLAKRHPNIRPPVRVTVDRYARQMLSGVFLHSGNPVSFDCNGYLINGQHRLIAIVETGLTLPFQVTRGESADAWRIQNQDMPERASTLLGCMDKGASYPARRAMIANFYLRFQLGVKSDKDNIPTHITFSPVERAMEAARIKADMDWIMAFHLPAPAAAAMILARPVAPAKVERFVKLLTKPTGLEDGSPVLLALEIIRSPARNDSQAIEMMYRLLRAAQLYVEGLSGTRYVKTTVNGYGFFLRGRAEQNIPW